MSDNGLEVFDRDALNHARRQALLREAGRQFAEKGFHGTSLNSIASGVKLTKSGLFHYVRNKEELLFACYRDALLSAEECLTAAEDAGGDAPAKIGHYLRNHLSRIGKPGGYFTILSELYVLDAEQQKELRATARRIDARLRALIEAGIKEGSIGYDNPRMAVYAIDGALNWLPKWYSTDGAESIEEIAEDFIRFFLDGLRKR
ncbi:TetR/AcrR family transcriptional regulator [Pseudohaliea rubra]|uniref:Transcriptional regulator, TetR family n=1 Tax=Pseudohaliea rubra DSM 19751 TaxID=1265313 RepID=A0A095VSD5_9GAMM|nr:TetR/AcrR family transcriptional regulator [Pseudohaliea rubra]KGE04372.1 Transcriptional regulator, TetR family [Pseudohaliea rubra DSM 19751]